MPRQYRRTFSFFFFNDTATTEIYTLSLHDALPISQIIGVIAGCPPQTTRRRPRARRSEEHTSELQSHSFISYAVFCLKTKIKACKRNSRPVTKPYRPLSPFPSSP